MKENQEFIGEFNQLIGPLLLREELKKYTSMGVGGPALYFAEIKTLENLKLCLNLCSKYKIKYFIIGGGTNTIFSDKGFDGLIIKPNLLTYEILDSTKIETNFIDIKPRHNSLANSPYSTEQENSFNDSTSKVYVKLGTSWRNNAAFQKLHSDGITGYEWFTGIPGTVGGAVYMNIHGGKYYFSDFLIEVEVMDSSGEIKVLKTSELNFDYDYSLFHKNKNLVIVSATLQLFKGDIEKALIISKNWGLKKTLTQPQRSSGCMFQNLPDQVLEKHQLPTPSMGYLIDKVLNLKGKQIGGAVISPKHCAFIENQGNAQASDVYKLTKLIEEEFNQKFAYIPKLEVEFIGDF